MTHKTTSSTGSQTSTRRWLKAQRLEAGTRPTKVRYDDNQKERIARELEMTWATRQRLVEQRFGIDLPQFREMCVMEIGGQLFADRYLFGTEARHKVILDPMPWPRVSNDTEFIKAVGERIPIRSLTVDICWASNVIDHCKAPSAVLNEIGRVLSENGRLYISCNVWPLWMAPFFFILDRIDGCHPHHFSKSSFLRLLAESGFIPEMDFGAYVPHMYKGIRVSIVLKVMLSRLWGERMIHFRLTRRAYPNTPCGS